MAKGTGLGAAVLAGVLVAGAVPALGANAGIAEPADTAIVDLKRSALAGEEPDRDPLERLREAVLAESPTSTRAVEDAVRRAQQANGTDARERVLEAEAMLLRLARANALAAHADGNDSAALAWLNVTLARVHPDVRNLTRPAAGEPVTREPLVEALDAAIAVRAREAVWEAFLLDATGRTDAARITAGGAEALLGVLVPNATARLQPGPRAGLEENATRVFEAVTRPAADEGRHLFPGLAAPLTALQYSHDVEPLEVFGERVVDSTLVALRASREDPRLARTLAEAVWQRYGVDRGTLGLAGEGDIQPMDQALRSFRSALENRSAVHAAARGVRAEVEDVALLGHGVTVDLESGGVRPNRTHTYDVTIVRPPLEGIASLGLELAYDGNVLDVAGAEPNEWPGTLALEGGGTSGRGSLSGNASDPMVDAGHAIHLKLEAAGPPGSRTNLTVEEASFLEPDGDPIPVHIVRDAPITIANVTTGDGGQSEEATTGGNNTGTKSTPSLGLATAGLLALLAWARRRHPP